MAHIAIELFFTAIIGLCLWVLVDTVRNAK